MTARRLLPRALLVMSATIFAVGGVMHARAYFRFARPLLDANPNSFAASEFKALWLADSSTLLGLAMLLGFLIAKPHSTNGAAVLFLSLLPAGTTFLLYAFLGPFYAAHMLALGTGAMVVAGVLLHYSASRPGALGATGDIHA